MEQKPLTMSEKNCYSSSHLYVSDTHQNPTLYPFKFKLHIFLSIWPMTTAE